MKIILGVFLISWIVLYTMAEDRNPITSFKKSLKCRGLFKTIIFHLIMPLMISNALLEKITDGLEKFVDWTIG